MKNQNVLAHISQGRLPLSFGGPLVLLVILLFAAAGTPNQTQAVMKTGSIQCANLIYAGTNTSRCFSDEFLSIMQRETAIPTERRFRSVRLNSDELFRYPFVMMTGESDFTFTPEERSNLRRYLTNGGFMLASSGCSSSEWDEAFRRNIKQSLGDEELELTSIPMDHPIFRTVYNIEDLELSSESDDEAYLEGIVHQGKIVLIYSHHGLNNTANTNGCCCCGGNEIRNAELLNVNILMYALLH